MYPIALRSARRLLCLVVLLAPWCAPATGHAASVTFDRWQIGLQAAALQWGGMPPCGTPTFSHHESPVDEFGNVFDMEVRVLLDHPETSDCVIHVAEPAESRSAGDVCAEIVHEVGHLWGRDHTPTGIMARQGVTFRDSWACQRLIRRKAYATRCVDEVDGLLCSPVYRWSLR